MITHAEAREMLEAGFRRLYGSEPLRQVLQCCQAVGWLETNYGEGWKLPAAVGSFNMGAITAGPGWEGETFEHRDSYPDEHGENHWYTTKFRKYPSAQAGMTDLLNIVYLRRAESVYKAAKAGDVYGFSAALYDTGYYKGFGKTRDERIANHHKAVAGALKLITTALGEPWPNETEKPPADDGVHDLAVLAYSQRFDLHDLAEHDTDPAPPPDEVA